MSRLDKLDAYVTGELTGQAADAFEEAMFDAPDDPELGFLDRLARDGATLVAHHTFDTNVTRETLDALRAAGHAVQVVDAGPPGRRDIAIDRDSELVVTQLTLGRTDLERVDVELELLEHRVTKTMRDIKVAPDGILYGLCERPLAELAYGAGPTIARVRRRDGARDVLGEWHLVPTS